MKQPYLRNPAPRIPAGEADSVAVRRGNQACRDHIQCSLILSKRGDYNEESLRRAGFPHLVLNDDFAPETWRPEEDP
jgi:hypothetical protein